MEFKFKIKIKVKVKVSELIDDLSLEMEHLQWRATHITPILKSN